MVPRRHPLVMVLLALLLGAPPAQSEPLRADVNLITAIDVSGSVDSHAEWLQFDGVARALEDASFLQTVAVGLHGRVGFAVFTWSSGGEFLPVVPWTLIASPEDARRVGRELREARGIPRFGYGTAHLRPWRSNGATDISEALLHATSLAIGAPYRASRTVLNICSNGTDNIGEGPERARDEALALGLVVNGLVLGREQGEVARYFRDKVQGGEGSFVLHVREPKDVASAMLSKFLMDIAGRPHAIGALAWLIEDQ
jgi:Ca-activated chloride channel homolog